MANALTYISNLGKSVGYSAIDEIKNMNPAVTSFKDTNGDIGKSIYNSIKNVKKTIKTTEDAAINSKVGELAKSYKDNLFDDLKTGKFYNKERIKRDEAKIGEAMMGDVFDEFNGDDGFGDFNFDDLDADLSSNDMMDLVGEKSSAAISMAVAKSSEYIVQANKESTKALYDQQNVIFGHLHTDLGTLNKNIATIIETSRSSITHYENSKTFFESSNALDKERNDILKEMLELQKSVYKPEKSKSRSSKLSYDDIVDANGIPDLRRYMERVKGNIKGSGGGTMDMVSMMLESGILTTLTSSPMKAATDLLVKKMMPKMLKDSMKEFNSSLSGAFGTFMLRLTDFKDSDNPIVRGLASILGVDDSIKTGLDSSKYEKGAVPFDGITRKAIIEVIPTYLSKILTAVSGNKESRYNYDQGKFVTVDSLKKELSDITKNRASSASYDMREYTDRYKKNIRFNTKNDEDMFDAQLEAIIEKSYKNGKLFNYKNKNTTAASYGLKGGKKAEVYMAIIKEMFNKMPNSVKMQFSNEILSNRSGQNRDMETRETNGNDVLFNLFNGSTDDDMSVYHPTGIDKSSKSKIKNKKATIKKSTYRSYSNEDAIDISNLTPDEARNLLSKKIDIENIKSNSGDKVGIITKLLQADSLSGKTGVILSGIDELAQKPAKFLAAIFDKADQRMFDLIYGSDNDKTGRSSFIGNVYAGLKSTFTKFNDWMDEKIFSPLSEKFTKENIHNTTKKLFNIFGIDIDKTMSDMRQYFFGKKNKAGIKEENGVFGSFIDETKNSFKSVFSWVKNSFMDVANWLGVFGKKDKSSNIPGYATGTRRVDRTGVAVLSEGEMVIPQDLNPYNVKRRQKNENKARKNFIDNTIPGFAEGGTYEGTSDPDAGLGTRMSQEIHSLYNYLSTLIGDSKSKNKGVKSKKQYSDEFKQAGKDVVTNIKKYAPDMVTGGIIGGGVSLLTGLVGGPLVGAAAGSAIALIKRSDKVQNWLFGVEKDGDREGGAIPKQVTDVLLKYIPNMAKGATVGAITSMIPFVPGGPIAGIILGSAAGFVTRNENVQNALFGEEGVLKGFPEQVKKTLPRMGLGAIAGLVAGPFGVTTNIMLGSALGFASDTNKFKDIIFGKEDDKGNRVGGIYSDLTEWFKKDIGDPLARSVDPLKKQMKLMISGVGDFFKKKIDNFFDKTLGGPFAKFIKEKILDGPLGRLTKGVAGAGYNLGKNIISAPARAIGAVGDHYRRKHVREGNADYMSAAERIAYRQDNKHMGPGLFGDKYNQTDELIAGMDSDQLQTAYEAMQYARNTKGASKLNIKNSKLNIKKKISSSNLNYKQSKSIINLVQKGKIDAALKLLDKMKIPEDEKSNLYNYIETEGKKFTTAVGVNQDLDLARDSMFKKLNRLGFKNLDKGSMKKYESYLKNEISLRGDGNEDLDTVQFQDKQLKERHNQIINEFQQIRSLMERIVDPKKKVDNDRAIAKEKKSKIKDSMFSPAMGIVAPGFGGDDDIFGDIASKFGKKKKSKVEIVNGIPMKYVQNKQGEWVADKSNSDTKKGQDKIDEEGRTQKGILTKLSEMPGKFFSFFGGEKKEEDENKHTGLFGKILKKIGMGVGIATIIGGLPYFGKFYEEKIKPIFGGLIDKVGDKALSVWDKFKTWLSDDKEGFSYIFREKILPFWLNGFEYLMGNVVPKMAQILVEAAPAIIKSIGVGLNNLGKGLVDELRGKQSPDEMWKVKDGGSTYEVKSLGITGPSGYKVSSGWATTPVKFDTDSSSTGGSSNSQNGFGSRVIPQQDQTLMSKIQTKNPLESTPKNLPKAFNGTNSAVSSKVSKQYNNIKSNQVQLPDGQKMTIEQMMNSDVVVGTVVDNNGNEIEVKGVDILNYPELAKTYGIDSSLTAAERKAQNEKMDIKEEKTLGGRFRDGLIKSFVRGGPGIPKTAVQLAGKVTAETAEKTAGKTILKTGGKVLGKIPFIGSAVKAGSTAGKAGKGLLSLSGKAGRKILPDSYFNKSLVDTKLGTTIKNKTASALNNKTITELKDKFLSKVGKDMKKFFSSEKIINLTQKFAKESGETISKEAMEEVAEKSVKKVLSELTERLSKKLAKYAVKLSAYLTTAYVVAIASGAIAFVSGYNNANSIVGVTEQPPFITRLVCAIASALNEIFCVGIIPLDFLFEILYPIITKVLDIDTSKLDKQREDAQTEVAEYNRTNGTDLSLEQYNKRNKLGTKIKNKAKDAWDSFSTLDEKAEAGTKKLGKNVSSGVKSSIEKFNKLDDNVNEASKKLGEKINKATKNGLEKVKYNFDEVKRFIFGNDDDNPSGFTNVISGMNDLANAGNIGGVFSYSTKTSDNAVINVASDLTGKIAKPFYLVKAGFNKLGSFFKETGSNSKDDFGALSKYASNGQVSNILTYSATGEGLTGLTNKLIVNVSKPIFAISAAFHKLGSVAKKGLELLGFSFNGSSSSTGTNKSNNTTTGPISNYRDITPPKVAKGSGIPDSTFVSQLDSKYANKTFRVAGDSTRQTIGDSGCGPAAATMVINSNGRGTTMQQASKDALKYKVANGGVQANYFQDVFSKQGMDTNYISDTNPHSRSQKIYDSVANGNKVVLMGQDNSNTSKVNSPYGPNAHYVVANGLSQDGKYMYINDPESNKPNIPYPTNTILSSSQLGISASASGTGLTSKMMKQISRYVGRATLPGADNQEKIWNYLKSKGCSDACAAGIIGNLMQESSCDPTKQQNGGGPGRGIAQWETGSGRFNGLQDKASSMGVDWSDLHAQLEWLWYELSGAERTCASLMDRKYGGFGSFIQMTDVHQATDAFEKCFERAGKPNMARRYQYADDAYNKFSGKYTSVDGASDSASSESSSGSVLDNIFGSLDNLAVAFGLKAATVNASDGNNNSGGAIGGTTKQQELVNKMKSIEGTLKYAQNNASFPGPRNAEGGVSSDCSETVQWAYKKVLNVDPGSWTGAQETDSDLYTVTRSFDESKMQPGDLILYNGHVEMYAGNGQMIGHGGPGKGPTTKKLSDQGRFKMVRRWTGFEGGATGSGLPQGKGTSSLARIPKENNNFKIASSVNDKISNSQTSRSRMKNVNITSGRASGLGETIVSAVTNSSSTTNNSTDLIKTILQVLVKVVQNTDNLSTVVALLTQLVTNTSSNTASTAQQQANNSALKATLIKTLNDSTAKTEDQELMNLIKSVNEIAQE